MTACASEPPCGEVPPKLRAVVVLRFLEGLSVQQTAEALGFPAGTVKSYTSRGLDTLRQILGVPIFTGRGDPP